MVKALSKTEMQVFEAIAAGKTTKALAHELNRSRRTLEIHRRHILEKLHARNVPHAIAIAFQRGILQIEPENYGNAISDVA